MKLPWEEGEFVFCDLQDIVRLIRKRNPERAVKFWIAAYATFDFIGDNPEIGRRRFDLQRPDLRSWQVRGFTRYLILYRVDPDRVMIYRVLDGTRNMAGELAES